MIRKIKKMKYGTVTLAAVTPAAYMLLLAVCVMAFPAVSGSVKGQIARLAAGAGTALFAYMYHMAARELKEKRNMLISGVHLCLFGIIYVLLLLMPVPLPAMPGALIRAVGLLYITFAGHSSIVGAWMFMFVMEIVRSIRKR